MSSRKNVVVGNISNRDGIIAIGDNIVIQQLADKKRPRDYLADLPPLPDQLSFPAAPYCGLRWFTREDARIFFGRGDKIKTIYEKLTLTGARSVTLLHGQSGVGKSSLLHAGLLPRLEGKFDLHYLRRDSSLGFLPLIKRIEEGEKSALPRLIILDQFEEIITQPLPGEALEAVELAQLIAQQPATKWLISFRKEYLAEFTVLFAGVNIEADTIYLEPLQWSNVLEAVEGVSIDTACKKQYGLSFDPGVAEAITHDIMRDADAHKAPALQILLLKLWRVATGKVAEESHLQKVVSRLEREQLLPQAAQPRITERHYQLLVAESGLLMDDFLQEQINAIRSHRTEWVDSGLLISLLYQLTTPRSTADSLAASSLRADFGHTPELDQLLVELRDRYLITEVATDSERLRLAHDALAPLIRARFRRSEAKGPRAAAVLESRLRSAAHQQRPAPLDKTDLQLVLQGQAGMRKWTAAEEQLIHSSRQQQQKNQRRRILLLGILGLLFIALSYTGWRSYQGQRLQEARLLEANADNYQDPKARIRSYAASLELNPSNLNGRGKLYATYREHHFPSTLLDLPRSYRAAFQPDGSNLLLLEKEGEGHTALHYAYDPVADSFRYVRQIDAAIHADQEVLLFSTDGQTIISGGNDHYLHAWRLSGSPLLDEPLPDRQSIQEMAISPNGRYLLAAAFGQARLFFRDLQDSTQARNIDLEAPPLQLCFLTENLGFLILHYDGRIQQYSLNGSPAGWLPEIEGNVSTLVWDNARQLLAVGTTEGQLQLLRYASNSWQTILTHASGAGQEIVEVSFAPQQPRIAILYRQGIDLISWEFCLDPAGQMDVNRSEGEILQLSSQEALLKGSYQSAAFTPGGRLLAYRQNEGVFSWPLRHLLPAQSLLAPQQEAIATLSFSEHLKLVTGTYDENLTAWQWPRGTKSTFGAAHDDYRIRTISSAGQRMVSGDENGRLCFFSADLNSINSATPSPHTEAILRIALSPDGRNALSYGADQILAHWNAETAELITTVEYPGLRAIAWNPQTRLVTLLDNDFHVRSYDPADWTAARFQFELDLEGDWNNLGWLDEDRLLIGGARGSGIFTSSGEQLAGLPALSMAPGTSLVSNACPDQGKARAALMAADGKSCFLLNESGFAYQRLPAPLNLRGIALCGDQVFLLTDTGIESWWTDRPEPLEAMATW